MIAEDFGPVYTRPVRTRGQKTREGLRAKRGRARPAQSAIGTIIDIAVKLVKPKSFLTPTSGLVSIHVVKSTVCAAAKASGEVYRGMRAAA